MTARLVAGPLALRAPTPFGDILRRAVLATPGAVGGAFAARDGELVDSYASWDDDDWAILTAHYGIVLAQMKSAFGCWHYGSPEWFVLEHGEVDVIVHTVGHDYYALLAVVRPASLRVAISELTVASRELAREMA